MPSLNSVKKKTEEEAKKVGAKMVAETEKVVKKAKEKV